MKHPKNMSRFELGAEVLYLRRRVRETEQLLVAVRRNARLSETVEIYAPRLGLLRSDNLRGVR